MMQLLFMALSFFLAFCYLGALVQWELTVSGPLIPKKIKGDPLLHKLMPNTKRTWCLRLGRPSLMVAFILLRDKCVWLKIILRNTNIQQFFLGQRFWARSPGLWCGDKPRINEKRWQLSRFRKKQCKLLNSSLSNSAPFDKNLIICARLVIMGS